MCLLYSSSNAKGSFYSQYDSQERERERGEGLPTMLIWNNIFFVLRVYRLVMRRHIDVYESVISKGNPRSENEHELPSLGILSRQNSYLYSCQNRPLFPAIYKFPIYLKQFRCTGVREMDVGSVWIARLLRTQHIWALMAFKPHERILTNHHEHRTRASRVACE